ncbi:hypothetical protein FDP41_002684 [Naegleria fowleri]|uniref:Uncharacterized protein n=1 Tax=Naegleria fowleri TaxID=5763 RepID=A0A6A5BYZ6_NAEFO|nr:uncharacterized protein FDP41_002684 [Naegleria fowleri]KAF0978169.1 hypothetical protein FDP41_002684 [Naegleria fowleri]CAG4715179.1 unnamed protein product [Naegleria fowleri]
MGICASNIRTTTLEPASSQDDGKTKKLYVSSTKTTQHPTDKQPMEKTRTDLTKHEDDKQTGENKVIRTSTKDNITDPSNPNIQGNSKPADDSKAQKKTANPTTNSNNVASPSPNGDFKISFSEQGDKYLSVQKWLNEAVLNEHSPNPILPIGGVFIHNMPPEEKNSLTSHTNPKAEEDETSSLSTFKRHNSMIPSTKHYEIS